MVAGVSMKAGNIYVDLDDVLGHTGFAFLKVLDERFGRQVEFDSLTSFDLSISFGLDRKQLERFMRYAHEPDVLGGIEPVAGASEVLDSWIAAGYEISVMTGRPPSTAGVSRAWLARHRIPHGSLHFVDKYSQPDPGTPDEQVSRLEMDELGELDFCLAIEDSWDTAVYLAGSLGMDVVLVERPWNRGRTAGPEVEERLTRCADWSEIRERFALP
jgi:uncharacterized HAD superfamily protein